MKSSHYLSALIGILLLVGVGYILQYSSPVDAAGSGTLLPISDGTYRSWTPSSGSTHYTMVNEATCNGVTNYNRTTTVGARDSYRVNLSNVPDGSTITAIQITPCASKNASGGANSIMNVFYRFNAVNSADAGNYSLTGTTPVSLSTTNFTGLSLLKNSTTVLEIGAVLTSGGKGARLGRISASVTYTPTIPAAPSNLSASVGVSTGTTTPVTLGWVDNSNNESYFVLESSLDGVNFNLLANPPANYTSWVHTAPNGATYYYRIKARNESGDSAYSNTASAIVP